jgi:hypothetical protein
MVALVVVLVLMTVEVAAVATLVGEEVVGGADTQLQAVVAVLIMLALIRLVPLPTILIMVVCLLTSCRAELSRKNVLTL